MTTEQNETVKPVSRFDYVKYDEIAIAQQNATKELVSSLEQYINVCQQSPAGQRALHLALTKLEECYMWVGKLIRDEQIERNGSAPLQEERANS